MGTLFFFIFQIAMCVIKRLVFVPTTFPIITMNSWEKKTNTFGFGILKTIHNKINIFHLSFGYAVSDLILIYAQISDLSFEQKGYDIR